MKSLFNKNVILWDFDGVIIDSDEMRIHGFQEILKNFPTSQVNLLLEYHKKNGGLSRYHKIRYFFENIRLVNISDEEIQKYADDFSLIMKKELVQKKYLIEETIDFIKKNKSDFKMHIVSGSDEKELNFLCKSLEIADYFISIKGSPTHKNQIVKELLSNYSYVTSEVALIGDSMNDYEASINNGIDFYGYNNEELLDKDFYIENFNE